MKRIITFLIAINGLILLLSCSQPNPDRISEFRNLTIAGETADFPQMIQTPREEIIMWWIERDHKSGEQFVYFSESTAQNIRFQEANKIPGSRKVNASGENLPKLVVKPDGTYVLIFSRQNEDSPAPFASSVLYTQSFDSGQTWTKPKRIHSDADPDNGHGFPEAILLPDGEVAAVWLDGRNDFDHSELYFAKTNGKEGFGPDRKIGGPSCECCKLDMYVDSRDKLHLTYRSILDDNIRDIMYLTADGAGTNFSEPVRISEDNWRIRACPHNGPSLTAANKKIGYIWYTLASEDRSGLFYTSTNTDGTSFTEPLKITSNKSVNHLYIASEANTKIMIWDELFDNAPDPYRRVKLAVLNSADGELKTTFLTPEDQAASMPYLLELNNGRVLAAWVLNPGDGNEIMYMLI